MDDTRKAELRTSVDNAPPGMYASDVTELLDALDAAEAETDRFIELCQINTKTLHQLGQERDEARARLAAMTQARDTAVRWGNDMMLDQREMRERAEAQIAELRAALEWAIDRFRALLASKPVKDVTEMLACADSVLAAAAPPVEEA